MERKLRSRGELEEAFRRTVYRVFAGSRAIELRVGDLSLELDRWLGPEAPAQWVWLTAVNPQAALVSEEENSNRLEALDRELENLGLQVLPGEAVALDGSWPPEPSRLVVGLDRTSGLSLARQFGQRAILVGGAGKPVELVWTDTDPFSLSPPGRGAG